jgi:hypothetical protein
MILQGIEKRVRELKGIDAEVVETTDQMLRLH